MKKHLFSTLALAAMLAFAFAGGDKGDKSKKMAGPTPGDVAPSFALQDQNGQTHSLEQYRARPSCLNGSTKSARTCRSSTTAAT